MIEIVDEMVAVRTANLVVMAIEIVLVELVANIALHFATQVCCLHYHFLYHLHLDSDLMPTQQLRPLILTRNFNGLTLLGSKIFPCRTQLEM